jgi:hypothetical protein
MKKFLALLFLSASISLAQENQVIPTNATVVPVVPSIEIEGSVTTFSAAVSPDVSLLSVGVATATTTPALTITWAPQVANCLFAGPTSGGSAAPTCRALNFADIGTAVITGLTEKTTPAAGDYVMIYDAAGVAIKKAQVSNIRATKSKTIVVLSPGAAENINIFYTPVAITITQVHAVVSGSSTPSVTYNVKYSTDRSAVGTNVTTSPSAVTNTTTGVDATLNNTAPAAASFLSLITTAQSGTVTELSVTVVYTEN